MALGGSKRGSGLESSCCSPDDLLRVMDRRRARRSPRSPRMPTQREVTVEKAGGESFTNKGHLRRGFGACGGQGIQEEGIARVLRAQSRGQTTRRIAIDGLKTPKGSSAPRQAGLLNAHLVDEANLRGAGLAVAEPRLTLVVGGDIVRVLRLRIVPSAAVNAAAGRRRGRARPPVILVSLVIVVVKRRRKGVDIND